MAGQLRMTSSESDRQAELSPSAGAVPMPLLWSLLGRHIAFHRRLVDVTANVKAALMLSQSIYWTRRGRDIALNGGWFHKSSEQWAWETGLSAREQGSAREALRLRALIEERRVGVPARLFFRLDLETLAERLASRMSDRPAIATGFADWQDMVVVAELLGPSVAYHRTLAGVVGGVNAGLMLSRALYRTRLQVMRDLDAWICNSASRWSEEIGLTRREQETARRDLARAGVWEEGLRGIPPSLVARIRLDCLLDLLSQASRLGSEVADLSGGAACGNTTISLAPNRESSLRCSHRLVSTKPPSQIRQNRHHCFDESAKSIGVLSTGDSVHTQTPAREAELVVEPAGEGGAGGGGGELIFPDRMQPSEREAARVLLQPCGHLAQSLLDELEGRLQAQAVRVSPVAYLRGLIARALAGTFTPEAGVPITTARQQRQLAAEERAAREAEERRQAALQATPEYQARVRAQRERIKDLLADMKQRMAAGRAP